MIVTTKVTPQASWCGDLVYIKPTSLFSCLQSTGLDSVLDSRNHLLDVVPNVLLAGALVRDLGAHDAHKDPNLKFANESTCDLSL